VQVAFCETGIWKWPWRVIFRRWEHSFVTVCVKQIEWREIVLRFWLKSIQGVRNLLCCELFVLGREILVSVQCIKRTVPMLVMLGNSGTKFWVQKLEYFLSGGNLSWVLPDVSSCRQLNFVQRHLELEIILRLLGNSCTLCVLKWGFVWLLLLAGRSELNAHLNVVL